MRISSVTMERGIRTKEGEFLKASRCRLLRSGKKNCWLEITLDEGKNRQIRRMLEALGVKVLRLVRVAIGPLQLSTLAKGTHRRLSADEKQAFDRALTRGCKSRKPPTVNQKRRKALND